MKKKKKKKRHNPPPDGNNAPRVTALYVTHNSPLANTIQVLHALSVWLLARVVAQVLVQRMTYIQKQ